MIAPADVFDLFKQMEQLIWEQVATLLSLRSISFQPATKKGLYKQAESICMAN